MRGYNYIIIEIKSYDRYSESIIHKIFLRDKI